ncbi:unnamed protein product [Psylliodes chrysocephalus]|uniref:Amidase domain-containing protein n=1 Tax=Psylliodes chrysocephalus TaxID=3402493 RepID=A0A9P0CU73_9CUCU|nr:unnamed protein product [Psylliodes chrysocephala]
MSTVENLNKEIKISQKQKRKVFCDYVKGALLKTFLLVRYYLDLLIDYIFGYFNDYKRVPIKKCTNPIILQSATALARKIKKRELTSEEVVQAYIDRIKEVNPILNALVDSRYEAALEEARKIDKDIAIGNIQEVDFQEKPFLGVPFTTKESSAVEGMSFTFGIIKRKGRKALFDADYVDLIKKAGAICLGTTFRTGNEDQTIVVMGILARYSVDIIPVLRTLVDINIDKLRLDEFVNVKNLKILYTSNPDDISISPSRQEMIETFSRTGQETGSTMLNTGPMTRFAEDLLPVLKVLVGENGITFRTGQEAGSTMVNTGPMTRFAEDLLPVLKVLVGENGKKLKLNDSIKVQNIKITYILNPKDSTVSPFRDSLKDCVLRAVNHFKEISNTPPEEVEFEGTKYAGKLWKYWMSQESGVNFMKDITDRTGEASPLIDTIKHFTVGGDYTTSTIYNFINKMLPMPDASWAESETEKLKQQLLEKLGDNGVLLYPSAPFPASYHHASYLRPWNFHFFVIWNVLKFPVTQVPMGLSKDGLPVGIQVVAAPYQDHLCIAVAKELEKAFGGYVPPFETE